MPDQPNFLILMSDQHHPHVMGCEGDLVVRTPNLDALAGRGMLFEDCYCPAPLCVPSRMSFLTGRYPTGNRAWSNKCILNSQIPTFAHALGAAGYETVLTGRMHIVGPDHYHGFEKRLVGDVTPPFPGSGFDALPPDLSRATGQSYPAVATAGPGRTGYQVFDEHVADAAAEYLNTREDDRPLCMVAGFVLPHCPFVCTPEDWDYYIDRVALPDIPDGYFDDLHPAMQTWRRERDVERITDEQILRARAGYYGIVDHFDRLVGQVLAGLEASGLAENTVVIYCSDHGEMAGEHGLWWKSNFYEGAASVPLIASWPGHIAPGSRSQNVVNLTDIGPTLLDLAGAPALPDTDGRSMAGLLRGDGAGWLDETFSEHYGSYGVPAARMIRRGQWKLVHFEGQRPQLFSLADDPGEWHDLGESPEHVGIRDELHRRVLAGWSAEEISRAMDRRDRQWDLLAKWYRQVQPDSPGVWEAPEGANVFPMEG